MVNHHVAADFDVVKVGSKALGGFVDASWVEVRQVASATPGTRGPRNGAEGRTGSVRIAAVPAQLAPVTAAGFPGAVLETMRMTPGGPAPEPNLTQGVVTSRQRQEPEGVGTIIHTATIGHGNSEVR